MSEVPAHEPGGLTEADLGPDPIARLVAWLDEARNAGVRFPEAAALATADPDGAPAVRHVLVKVVDERGLTFFTNRESRKGRQLAENPNAGLAFYWRELDRQVCVTGGASLVDDAESDEYFRTRPREARIGAWASRQSRPVELTARARCRVRRDRGAVPGRGRAAPPALGRLPHPAGDDRVLEGARAPPPRPVPFHARRCRVAARTALAVGPSNGDGQGIVPPHACRRAPRSRDRSGSPVPSRSSRTSSASRRSRSPATTRSRSASRAEATAETLEAAGYGGVRLIELPDVEHPAVFGEVAGPGGRADDPALRPPRHPARGTARGVDEPTLRTRGPRRPSVRSRHVRRQVRHHPARRLAARVGRQTPGVAQGPGRGRGGGDRRAPPVPDRRPPRSSWRPTSSPSPTAGTGGRASRRSRRASAGSWTASSRCACSTSRCTAASTAGPRPTRSPRSRGSWRPCTTTTARSRSRVSRAGRGTGLQIERGRVPGGDAAAARASA